MSDRQLHLESIGALLRGQSTLTLSTADEFGEPWATPLFYIVDEELTLYWLSSKTSLHSVNLMRSPRAAVAVYRQTDNWKGIQGVQMRGQVATVGEPARRKPLIKTYIQRFELGIAFKLAISQCHLFAFRPDFIRLIDNSKVFGSRTEIKRGPLQSWTVFNSIDTAMGDSQ